MPKSPIPVKEEDLSTRQLLLNLNKRLSFATIFLGAAVAGLGVAFSALLPLKETKPYIIEVARDGSAVVPAQTEAVAYNPSFDSLTFFLRRWVVDAFTINQYSTVKTLDPRARSFLRGENALGAYRDFLSSDGKFVRMAQDPQMLRDVEILTTTPVAGTDNALIFDVRLVTRAAGVAKEERRMVTVYYEIFPPKNRRDVEINPLGIFVTDFKVGFDSYSKNRN